MSFESVLELIAVGSHTPYNAVMGRVPRMLPSIDHIRSPEVTDSGTSVLEHTHRLREIVFQEMVESSAQARLGRALNTRSTPAAQKMELRAGEDDVRLLERRALLG